MGKTKYYAVRRGRVPGIYESWDLCKRQTDGFSSCEYKSFSSYKEAEIYIGKQSPKSSRLGVKASSSPKKTRQESAAVRNHQAAGSQSKMNESQEALSQALLQTTIQPQQGFYQLEFDGASKGNPGKAGAGALLRNPDGSVECELSEGLGIATNNVAEYRGLILGLRAAIYKGAEKIIVKGDSKLVCEQIMGRWQVRNEGLKPLWEEAKFLKSMFSEFRIQHVDREFNPRADALANTGVTLPESLFQKSSAPPPLKEECVRTQLAATSQSTSYQSQEPLSQLETTIQPQQGFYQLEFDGASKGNPGKAGAGALLRNPDGSVECELSEGLGIATNNVAEYRGLILGLRAAVHRGAQKIIVKGDSKLVCEQTMGRWQVKNQGLKPLWEEADFLKRKFADFRIEHVDREFNPRADALANIGVTLPESMFESSKKL